MTWLGQKKSRGIRLAVMDMWKPFRNATNDACAAGGDPVRQVSHHAPSGRRARHRCARAEYARLSGKDRRFIKGQKYTLLSHRENLTLEGRQA